LLGSDEAFENRRRSGVGVSSELLHISCSKPPNPDRLISLIFLAFYLSAVAIGVLFSIVELHG